jgi:hypothetical protein
MGAAWVALEGASFPRVIAFELTYFGIFLLGPASCSRSLPDSCQLGVALVLTLALGFHLAQLSVRGALFDALLAA